VATTLAGVGYSSLGYSGAGVRALALAADATAEAVAPTAETAASGRYPLARFLYAYVNRPPGRSLSPVLREFLGFIYSRQGQRLVRQDGYVPLPAPLVERQRAELGL
jgi:phosphate transport system substrate-binding protein